MQYDVRVLHDHRLETWRVDALDDADARRQVAGRQAQALSATPRRARGGTKGPGVDLGLFATDLAELLDAGLEIVESLSALADQERDPGTTGLARRLLERLHAGASFSQALAGEGERMPPLLAGLVRAGERSGGVLEALRRWSDYRRRQDELLVRLRSALVYPAVLLGVGGAVTLFLLGFVVPRFAVAYRGAEDRLPLLTRGLMASGTSMAAHPALAGAVLLALATGVVHAARAALLSGRLEAALAALPGVGPRVRDFRLAQLHLALGTLLQSGLPALAAIELAAHVMPAARRAPLVAAGDALRRGERWSDALAAHGLASPVSRRLLRAGEGTGRLAEMLLRSARHQDQALARWLDRFARLFEPVLMVAVGVLVGAIVVLLYLPIFDLAGSVS